MPERKEIVINTGPILALVAATGNLDILKALYGRVIVPLEVAEEILAGGANGFAVQEFRDAQWLDVRTVLSQRSLFLQNTIDIGEGAVIQTALDDKIKTVCIDEAAGRRLARLNNLMITGSVGMLLRAKKEGHPVVMKDALSRMQLQGIWLSKDLLAKAIILAGE